MRALVAAVAIMLVAGCATTPKPVSDEKLVTDTIGAWGKDIAAKDIKSLMTLYADDYTSPVHSTKAELSDYLTTVAGRGYIDGAVMDLTKSKTAIREGRATVTEVWLDAAFGRAKIDFTLKKSDGKWLITSMLVEEAN